MKAFLSKNWEAVIGILMLVGCFYWGRHTAPTKVETKTITVEVEKIKQHQNTVIVEKVNKDGSKETTTRIVTDTNKDTTKTSEQNKLVEKKSPLNIYALAGIDIANPANGFTVGAHISKQLLGPVSLGVFGFTNKTAGMSLGLNF
jgi:hypothetical protein